MKSDEILDAIKEAISRQHGLACHNIVLIEARTIPKTSSGKVQRRQCRQEYLDGKLAIVARNRAGAVAQEQLASLPDDTFFTERWAERLQARVASEGSSFRWHFPRPVPHHGPASERAGSRPGPRGARRALRPDALSADLRARRRRVGVLERRDARLHEALDDRT